jgi:2-phosphosulfolactate phosphatase
MEPTVIIDTVPERIALYRQGYAVVVVDVIRATTSAVTVTAKSGRCFPVPSIESASELATKLEHPLLVGELDGKMPVGFNMNNSPSELAQRRTSLRPVILLSSSGTKLMHAASQCEVVFVACFRNFSAVARYIAGRYPRVAIIGALSRGEFREEDQMCCGWIADALANAGYKPTGPMTEQIIEQWRGVPASACAKGKSAQYLRTTGQINDLNFVLSHINDVDSVFTMRHGEIVRVSAPVNRAPKVATATSDATSQQTVG